MNTEVLCLVAPSCLGQEQQHLGVVVNGMNLQSTKHSNERCASGQEESCMSSGFYYPKPA